MSREEQESQGGGRPVGEAAFRLMVAADFGVEPGTSRWVDRPVDELLAEMKPAVEGTAADRLDLSVRRDVRVRCTIECLDDFSPEGWIRKHEPAEEWLTSRRRLLSLADGHDATAVAAALPDALRGDAFGRRLADSSAVDSLLARVEDGGAPAAQAVAEIDRRLARQAAAVVSRPWLTSIEEAWRGLDFLHRRLRGMPGVRIELFSAPKAELTELFFQNVFHREYDGEVAEPLGLVALGYDFDRGQADLERLQTAARMGESLRVPFLGNLGPGFWGIKRLPLLAGLGDLESRLGGAEYVKWNRFRGDDTSLWLALTVNRFLLRGRWAEQEASETTGTLLDRSALPEADDPPLWGPGAWALAAAVAGAWRAGGLELPITASTLEDMAARPLGGKRSEPFSFPLQVSLGEARVLELGRSGLIPLVAKRDEDRVSFPLAPTLHRPMRYHEDEATRASFFAATLPHQVFAALASHRLQQIAEELELGLDDDALAESFRHQLLEFLGSRGEEDSEATAGEEEAPEVMIELETPADRPETRVVTVRLRPRFSICGGVADLVLGTAVLVG